MINANLRRIHLVGGYKIPGMGDGVEGTQSQRDYPGRPHMLKYGLMALGLEKKGLLKTLHRGKLIRLGNGLKVEDEAIEDTPMVSVTS